MDEKKYEIGMVGLGVMGRNLLLNMAEVRSFSRSSFPGYLRDTRFLANDVGHFSVDVLNATVPIVLAILSVPLGAVGGILGLQALNLIYLQSLDVLTMLGFIILIGTVVNNPILIVHQSLNHMREDHMPPRQAILESVRTRIRPIFMTTITTILGLLPLVLFPGSGSELYRGLGSVVLGGLLVSTLLTLVLVPTLFSLTVDLREWIAKLFSRSPAQRTVAEVDLPQPVLENVAEHGAEHGAEHVAEISR